MERPVICLGASAGGLEALQGFFENLPPGEDVAYVVIVHLSPDYRSVLPQLLGKRTTLPVVGIEDGMELRPGRVHVLPPGVDLGTDGERLQIFERAPDGPRVYLPIDRFLTQLAGAVGSRAVAVLLSGTGSDGSVGLRAIREAGGLVLVQDPDEAAFDGMPRAALSTGEVDHCAPVERLAELLPRLDRLWHVSQAAAGDLRGLVSVLRRRSGLDLQGYRQPMVARRVQRRMALRGVTSMDDYGALLEADANEVQALRSDVLIGVTRFFRDPDAYEALRTKVLPDLVARARADRPLRVWVAGCSTGEEVYSLAIALMEAMGDRTVPLKIFATDVNQRALAAASRGRYTLSDVIDLPGRLLQTYFDADGGVFTVRPQLRESVIFVPHDVITDAPFTRMDLVCCRNLLIYLDLETQQRVLRSLHFSLRTEQGVLFLGSAEAPAGVEKAVEAVDERHRLFRWAGPAALPGPPRGLRDPVRRVRREETGREDIARFRTVLEASLEVGERSAAIVSREGDLLDLLADRNGLFQIAKGSLSSRLAHLLPADVYAAYGVARARCQETGEAATYAVREGALTLQLIPLPAGSTEGQFLLQLHRSETGGGDSVALDDSAAERILQLEADVLATRETLQSAIEQLQTTNEEQQSTNEELVAANEELQSTNEELHSVNEELFTVNAELQQRNRDLQVVTADLDNLLESADVGTLFLDRSLRIRRFTAGVERVIRLQRHDVGRPITDFAHRLQEDFVSELEGVLSGRVQEREIRDVDGAWLLMRARPYRTKADDVEGVLLTFVDVSRLKNAEESARVSGQSLRVANDDLGAKAEQLETMFSVVSHDLRRPILNLDGLLSLAADALPEGGGELANRLGQARELVGQLGHLVRDLSLVAETRQIPLEPERRALRTWLGAQLAPFEEVCERQGVRLNRVCDNRTVRFARVAAEAALTNLLENALRYGCGGEQPEVDVSVRVSGNLLTLVVSDNGKGIAPEDHERVFEIFQRLDPSIPGGTGVGLVSARRLVERAQGTVTLESALGQGARFEVRLPIQVSGGGPVVLLVDDDVLDVRAVRRELGDLAEVAVGASLEQAREFLSRRTADLVLLDLSLPDGHGLRLLDDLRSRDTVPPVVLLTGHGDGVEVGNLPPEVVEVVDKAVIGKAELVSLLWPLIR